MASNYTPNFKLCQWAASDKVLHTEFNADNAKIDAALLDLTIRMNDKASTADIENLEYGLNDKAGKVELDILSKTVAQHAAKFRYTGDCNIYLDVYEGDGTYGADHPCFLSYPYKLCALFLASRDSDSFLSAAFFYGQKVAYLSGGGAAVPLYLTWGTDRVYWYSPTSAAHQLNATGTLYTNIALVQRC